MLDLLQVHVVLQNNAPKSNLKWRYLQQDEKPQVFFIGMWDGEYIHRSACGKIMPALKWQDESDMRLSQEWN